MAKIEHINLIVTDIEKSLAFLTAAFPHWRVRTEGKDEWHRRPRRWLHVGDDETYLTLNNFLPVSENTEPQRDLTSNSPGLAHIGFEVASLDALVSRLEDAGFRPHHFGPEHPHRRNTYFIDAEGIEFEFVEYLSDLPEERNSDV